jgi:adsorption protein B
LLMLNRMGQRIFFVTIYYGLLQGMMSIPRLFWGNYINFLANWRAIRRIITEGNPHRVAWDKTTHDFPSIGETNRARRMVGQILLDHQVLTEEQLTQALTHKTQGVKIGTWLIHQGMITPLQFAQALAEQGGVEVQEIDAYGLDPTLIKVIPDNIALRYAVLPIRLSDGMLTLACESVLDPISLAALSRKLKYKIEYVIVPHGQVTVGLRHWYSRHRHEDPRTLLLAAQEDGRLTPEKAKELWAYFVAHQFLFAEVLSSLGRIDTASLSAVLLQHEKTNEKLGDFLVKRHIVSQETLDHALALQKKLQPAMSDLIAEAVQ